ncbi:universal stress protein [Microbulbifer sp. S227A]|uniref:universal stress protein n=1 Tax=Microbulbifer sp. S227A TaxID=3415131 RepID=UPI003C7AD0D3
MKMQNILCAYNGNDRAVASLRYAIRIASHYDGWLTGIVRHGRPVIESRFSNQLPQEILDRLQDSDAAKIRKISDDFTAETKARGLAERAEFLEITDDKELVLAEVARLYDLVVTGVPSRDIADTHLAAHPDLVALQSGRPVLVVPDAYARDGLADHAIVAWDGKRSAARALGDAMSVLEDKAKVTVLCVGKEAPRGSERLIRNLRRHGINAELLVTPARGSIGQTVLDTTRDIGAQLIVMGAYEHSKFSHDLFGGPTTDVMEHATVPVFLSH